MDTAKRFFHKYIFSTLLILLSFLIINVLLILGVLFTAWNNSTDPDISIAEISDGLNVDAQGTISADEDVAILLAEKNSWAMVLSNAGKVIWETSMPKNLPRQYTATEIAKFSKWYLGEYPVLVQGIPSGLLVIGCPPDSIVKYNFVSDATYISTTIWGIVLIVLINIILMLLIFLHNTRKVEKAVTPILNGIGTIAHGETVSLSEKGELAEVNTALNRAGQYISKKDKARAEWINGVSHDVRTPLSIMLGYSGEIEDNNSLPRSTREQAGIIRRQGEKLRCLIADLNLTSKLEYSMQPLNLEIIYPVELARQVITDFLNNGLDERYAIHFDASADESTITLQGDQSLLKRMLGNLIQNSISHNPEGCNINVILRKVKERCEFVICDDGVGIPEHQIGHFNNGDFSTKEYKASGETAHGFGLKLVYQIVHAHDGKIYFEANKPTGLCVKIYI